MRIQILKQSFEFLFFSYKINKCSFEYQERGSAKEVARAKNFELEGVLGKSKLKERRLLCEKRI